MKITFLGTGTSTGIPVLGCGCEVCRSTDTRDHRLRTSALITTDTHRHILIDAGPDLRTQLLTHHNAPIDGVLVTHSHYDHVGGIDDLRTLTYPNGSDIYCRQTVNNDLHRLLPYCFNNKYYPNIPKLRLHTIEEFKLFELAGVMITPLPVKHGALDILGYRINNMAYITDATLLPTETIDAIKDIDTLVINSLRITPNPTHMNLEQSLETIRKINPRQAYLIHMSHQMGLIADTAKLLPSNVAFAYDGLTVSIPEAKHKK